MIQRLVIGVLVVIGLIPSLVFAATAGFVPSTGLWFSQNSFAPKELVYIYSVVVNTTYPSLSGTIAFYDNNTLIDTITLAPLAKDQARQVKVVWFPEAGTHSVSAGFTELKAFDSSGKALPIEQSDITATAGSPLVINGSAVTAEVTNDQQTIGQVSNGQLGSPEAKSSGSLPTIGYTTVAITQKNNQLSIAAPTASEPATSQKSTSMDKAVETFNGLFEKNRAALDKAQQFVATVTTTAGQVAAVYDQAKETVAEGQSYYQKGMEYWQKISPYAAAVTPLWLTISDNNNPKRVMILVGGVLVLYVLLRFRRARYREYYDR